MTMTLDGTSGITQMTGSIVMSGSTSGTTTIIPSAVAGSNTATLPAATGTVMVSGNMPAFSYYQSSAQTIASINTFTKVTFTSNDFDTTSGMFASSRFTPTVAGYYQVNGGVAVSTALCTTVVAIFKNGSAYKYLQNTPSSLVGGAYGATLVYLNGSTDYIELYTSIGISQALATGTSQTYFNGAMVRSA